MPEPLVIIPARTGSRGIVGKNFKLLAGASPMQRAIDCALAIEGARVVVSADMLVAFTSQPVLFLRRPAELATDTTPMIDVVKHVLAEIPGEPDQPILLVQPTQPLRQPKHLQQALALLTPEIDSVVSVVELPLTHHMYHQLDIRESNGCLYPLWWYNWYGSTSLGALPTRRQECEPTWIRDGSAYCFWRKTVTQYGDIYGEKARPLIIPAEETCPLDSEADWLEAERRIHAREA